MIPSEILQANAVDTITGAQPSAPNELGREDFLAMLIAQLENQDPLNPQDGTEFTAQLAQFSGLEQLISMRESLDALAAVQSQAQTLGAASLIGKKALVSGADFELGPAGAELPTLRYELSEPTPIQSIRLIAANGTTAATISNPGFGQAGVNEIDWNDFDVIPSQPGVYRLQVDQGGDGSAPRPLIESRVTGTALQDGILYLGSVQARLDDVREVRE